MSSFARRRGAIAAFAVGATILVLYVVLQPGDRPQRAAAVTTTTELAATTTTRPPLDELCALATEFVEQARDQDPATTARLAEAFYTRAQLLAPEDARPEYEAAANYYTEFNNIGEPYGYDLIAILGSPDGARWTQLVFGKPLGVPIASANVAFLCQVELPPPPTITTTTTRPRITTTVPEDPGATAPGAPAPAPPGTSAPVTPPPTAPG